MAKPIVRTFTDNATDNGFQQDSGVVASTPAQGDFYAIWRDTGNFNSSHSDIVGRHFDTFGNPLGGDVSLLPLNNAFGVPFNASQPATTILPISGQADGTATAFSDNFNNGPDFDVYVVRTNASLSRIENPLLIDGSTSVTNDPSVTSFADGGLVVSYTIQNSTTDWDVLARTVSASGVVGPVITLFNDTDRSDLSDLATLKNGNFVAVFESQFLGSPTDLDSFFTIKTESGANVVSPTTVTGAGSTATETNPHVAALAGGGFVVTWTDSAGDESGTSQGIRATVYDASGNVVPNAGDILVNQFNQAGTQLSNDVTALPDGGFEVAWEDVAAGVDRVQRFDAAGHLIGLPVTIANLATFDVNAATLTNGRSIYTFNDFSSGNNNTDSSILLYPQRYDFTGEGASDALFFNPTTGDVDEWKLSNAQWAGSVDLGTHPGGYQISGIGDFNGDGTSDVFWYNQSTGQTDIWELNNGKWMASVSPGNHPTGYQVAGIGDFNGNGTSDALFFNPTTGDVDEWKLSNGQWAGSVDLGTHPGGAQISGIGDFNGDGTSDVLWYNQSTGQTDIWELSNGQWLASVSPGNHPTGYQVAGIGDFTGNGTSDILFYNPTTGDVDEWKLANGQWTGSVDLGSHPGGSAWQISGTGDYNGDGIGDVFWYNSSTGQTDIWELSNTGHWAASASPGTHPTGYQLQFPNVS